MCLCTVDTEEEKRKFLESIKDEWIQVWKAVYEKDGAFHGAWMGYPYRAGLNICITPSTYTIVDKDRIVYTPYFHFFYCYPDLKKIGFNSVRIKVIQCYVKKENITCTGLQNGRTAIIAKKAIFPECPDTELPLKEKMSYGIPVEKKQEQCV